ncbi:MAG: putative RNA polymerase II subunit A [Streblomastix strix]|uniref:RNA polymerase II subunit A C-terminal domain phosphatase SSU72 n=1 Tax=Streblomastix strix TaxID=222440 RepID=A0A5J4V4J1_9EUKA|nr:MAG: putative RNA polymerase II subunit A [Streblomastix strix]
MSSSTDSTLKIACVCASNMNRSMEAHAQLLKYGMQKVSSYGTGKKVKIPSVHPLEVLSFDFGDKYADIAKYLRTQGEDFYNELGMLDLLERNSKIKPSPNRFQNEKQVDFDIVLTFEARVFEEVVVDMSSRAPLHHRQCHVINIETKDDSDGAVLGGRMAVELVQACKVSPDLDSDIFLIVQAFHERYANPTGEGDKMRVFGAFMHNIVAV